MRETAKATDLFVFDLIAEVSEREERLGVAYCSGRCDESEVIGAIEEYFWKRLPPDRLLLIGPQSSALDLKNVAASERVATRLSLATRYTKVPGISPIAFDIFGQARALLAADDPYASKDLIESVWQAGGREIFTKRDGILHAGHGRHFAKPSKKHSQIFIRTGNVLRHGAETGFLAWSLLRWIPHGTRHIVTDTASINSLAYAIDQLRRLIDPTQDAITVDSFSSYEGLASFRVPDEEHCVCLVSASTSGALEQEIGERLRLDRKRVVTLFYAGKQEAPKSQVLCNLGDAKGWGDEAWQIESYPEDRCPLCDAGSSIVRLSGDQFLPVQPHVKSVLVTVQDAPKWIQPVSKSIIGTDAVSCHFRKSETTGGVRQVFINVGKLLQPGNPFEKQLDRAISSGVPAALSGLVYLNDDSSVLIANRIREFYSQQSAHPLEDKDCVGADEFGQSPRQLGDGAGVVLVVASTTVTGRSLLSVSQLLRQTNKNCSVAYLVGMVRGASRRHSEELAKNLCYGQRADEYPLHRVFDLQLPDDRDGDGSPWFRERSFYQDNGPSFQDAGAAAVVAGRTDAIDKAESDAVGGLRSNCFLPRWVGVKDYGLDAPALKLRPGFAFWPFAYDPELVTQADVYLTVSGVIHRLRSGDLTNASLFHHEHSRAVLSPGNFTRFNDGVIQACLLRGALASELDYSHDARLSSQMKDVINVVLRRAQHEEGEAAPEFLLALAMGRLRLNENHAGLVGDYAKSLALPPFLAALAKVATRGL